MNAPFTVLAVCTGNICRSPAVERLFAAHFRHDPSVHFASAGTGALVSNGIEPGMQRILQARGVPTEGFAARQLTEETIRSAQLILALTVAHRGEVVEMYPGAVRRVFTVRELARLIDALPHGALPAGSAADRFAALIPLAARQRGMRVIAEEEFDVVDPYRGDDALFEESYRQIQPAVDRIARYVRG